METEGNSGQNKISAKFQKKLVLALESARTRFSIAIATESKSTPRDRWKYYLDTTDQISRSIKKLRNADVDSMPVAPCWIRALDMLEQLPMHDKALRLSQILRDIVMKLE